MRSEPQALKLNSHQRRGLRERIIARDGRFCRACGATTTLQLDHVEPLWRSPDRALDESNLQILCAPCHRRKTGGERAALLAHRRATA